MFYLEGCWESLGRAYLLSNELDSAEFYLKKVEVSALQNNGYEFSKEVYILLSQLYERKGDFGKSLAYQKLSKAHTDSLYSQNKMYQLNVLQVEHNLENIEHDKKILKERRLKDEAIIAEQQNTNIFITVGLCLVIVCAGLLGVLYHHKRNQSKNLLREVEKSTDELNKSNAELKQANDELKEFAHISFHDLREPIRNIHSFTNLIRKKGTKITHEELDEYATIIQFNAKQMQALVHDVYEFVNINDAKKELQVFSPDDLLNDILKLLNQNKKGSPVLIRKKIEVGNIKSNKGMLSIALRNLLENAMKYNDTKSPEIDIHIHNGDNQYTWYIKDNGIGIEPQYHERIFEMFKRLHNREKYEGSGLGLAITKKIIQRLEGDIGVISEEGKGSTFWFSIPKVD
ncbi:MAG: hypothetical protein H7X71_02040 [Chitinophagales bacterium]|nr:hypothetical protein [Chitinophagales bacterium]